MLDERTLYLINAEIDGELEAAEREELEAILEASAEARAAKAGMRRFSNLLDSVPAPEPPADLVDRIVGRIRLPAGRPAFSASRLFSTLQPAPMGLAFAAGLLVTVGFYETTVMHRGAGDVSSMVGTMLADPRGRPADLRDSLSISEPGITGRISLSGEGAVLVLNFELDSANESEVVVSLAGPGLYFGGIARPAAGVAEDGASYEVSGGTLRVVNRGQQSFSVFLLDRSSADRGSKDISIGITMGGASVFSGVLQG